MQHYFHIKNCSILPWFFSTSSERKNNQKYRRVKNKPKTQASVEFRLDRSSGEVVSQTLHSDTKKSTSPTAQQRNTTQEHDIRNIPFCFNRTQSVVRTRSRDTSDQTGTSATNSTPNGAVRTETLGLRVRIRTDSRGAPER